MKKPLINLVASTDQNFTEEELRQLWENLQLSRFMREAEIDPVRNVSATNLEYAEGIDVNCDKLTWDVEGEHIPDVNYYKIKCKNTSTSVTTVYETEEGHSEVRETIISPFLRPGTYKISVYPEGDIAAGSPSIITVTVLPMEDKINGFNVTITRNHTYADADYGFSTQKVSGDFDELNDITHVFEFGYEVTNPDGTIQKFVSANDVPSFILDKDVGTYTVRAYAKNDYELAYTAPVEIDGTFNSNMDLFDLDASTYNQRDTATATTKPKKMAEYISGYYVLENDEVKLTSYTSAINLSDMDISYGTHNCKVAAFDKLDNLSQKTSITVERLPYLDEIEMSFEPTDYYEHDQQSVDGRIHFMNGDTEIQNCNMRKDVEIQIDECATEPVIISAYGPTEALALATKYEIEASGTSGYTFTDECSPESVEAGLLYCNNLTYDPSDYNNWRTDIIPCMLSATPVGNNNTEGLTFVTEVKAAPKFAEALPSSIDFSENNIHLSFGYSFGDCTMHYRIDNGTIIDVNGTSGFDISIKDLEPGEHYLMVYWTKAYDETKTVKSHEVSLAFKVYSIEDIQPFGYVEDNKFYFGVSATSPEFATPKANSYKYYYETPDDIIHSGYNDTIDWTDVSYITAASSTSAGIYDVTVWPTNISADGDTIYEFDVGLPISGTLEAIVQ